MKETSWSRAWQEGFEAALRWARDTSQKADVNPYLADQPAATLDTSLMTEEGRRVWESAPPADQEYESFPVCIHRLNELGHCARCGTRPGDDQ